MLSRGMIRPVPGTSTGGATPFVYWNTNTGMGGDLLPIQSSETYSAKLSQVQQQSRMVMLVESPNEIWDTPGSLPPSLAARIRGNHGDVRTAEWTATPISHFSMAMRRNSRTTLLTLEGVLATDPGNAHLPTIQDCDVLSARAVLTDACVYSLLLGCQFQEIGKRSHFWESVGCARIGFIRQGLRELDAGRGKPVRKIAN